MQPLRSVGPARQGQGRRGNEQMHRFLSAGVQHTPWIGSNEQMHRVMEGEVPDRPHLAALGDEHSDPLSAVPFPCSDDPSATFEHANTGNPFVNGNGYFSNMMMDGTNLGDFDDYNNSYADQQSQAMQVSRAAASARPNHKRAKNFSDHEDEILVSAWLNISLDPVVVKDQKGGRYWSRINDYFHEHKTCSSKRTINSLMHRWETIQKCVNKFCGCLTRIELRRQSGTTMQDKVAEACALYKSEDEHHKPFQFMHCWNKLRTQRKWLTKMDDMAAPKTSNKKQKTISSVDPNTSEIRQRDDDGLEDTALTRHVGKKKSKATILQEKKKSVTTTLENMWA